MEPVDGSGLYRFAVGSLAQLAAELEASGADDADVALVVPVGGAMVAADAVELVEAARLIGGVCVAASPARLASRGLAEEVERAAAEAAGDPLLRCHPYPYGLVGPVGALRWLLADVVEGGSDADWLTAAVLSGAHDLVLDVSSQFFHVLDGTGTDVVMAAGRPVVGDERPLVVIDPVAAEPDPVARGGLARRVEVRSQPAEGLGLHTFAVDSLAQLAAELDAAAAEDSDVVLVLPAGAALVVAEPDEMVEAARLLEGICVAASPVAIASPDLAQQVERAVAEATGGWVLRCHPYPAAMVGLAGPVRALLAGLVEGDSDVDWLTAAVLSGDHDVVLDVSSQFFHVLDGTGTDVVMVAGRAHAADERPLVLIDPSPDSRAITLTPDTVDESGRDLRRLLRYDSAVAAGDWVSVVARDVLVTPLWSPEFCATVIRAAEAAGLWVSLTDNPSATVGMRLPNLIPHLVTLLKRDLDNRIWPLLQTEWPITVHGDVRTVILKYEAGGPDVDPVTDDEVVQFSGSVRLNDGYHGGGLVFPRYGWDDSAAPVGALTVWTEPGGHPDASAPVMSGVKYRLALSWRQVVP